MLQSSQNNWKLHFRDPKYIHQEEALADLAVFIFSFPFPVAFFYYSSKLEAIDNSQ